MNKESFIHDQWTQESDENRTHQQMQMVVIWHSVHSSSLHLTRLTCLQEVNTSSCHHPDFSHHPTSPAPGGDPTNPNLWLFEHQSFLVSFHGNMLAALLIQAPFCSERGKNELKKIIIIDQKKICTRHEYSEVTIAAPEEWDGNCGPTLEWFKSERQGDNWYCDSLSFDWYQGKNIINTIDSLWKQKVLLHNIS